MVKFDAKGMDELRAIKLALSNPNADSFVALLRSNLDSLRFKYERERDDIELRNLQGVVMFLSDLMRHIDHIDEMILEHETRKRDVAKKVKASQAINT